MLTLHVLCQNLPTPLHARIVPETVFKIRSARVNSAAFSKGVQMQAPLLAKLPTSRSISKALIGISMTADNTRP